MNMNDRIEQYEGLAVDAFQWLRTNWKGAAIVAFLSFVLAKCT